MNTKVIYRNVYSGAIFILIGDEEIQKRMLDWPAWQPETRD